MGSVLGSVSSAQMASGRPRNRFEHRGGLRRQKSSAPTIAEEVKGKAPCASRGLQPLVGRFPVRHVHPPSLASRTALFALSGPRPVGQGPHSTATALPAPGPANASSVASVVFAICSCTVATLSWQWGDGHTGPVGVRGTILISGTLENKERKIPKTKGALGRSRG